MSELITYRDVAITLILLIVSGYAILFVLAVHNYFFGGDSK